MIIRFAFDHALMIEQIDALLAGQAIESRFIDLSSIPAALLRK